MITFLPYKDFNESARVLDRRRLLKQILESRDILRILNGKSSPYWEKSPAVKMWKGYDPALAQYGQAMTDEWLNRGYNFKDKEWLSKLNNEKYKNLNNVELPPWLTEALHSSHRAALLKKSPEHYNQFNWKEEPEINYHWPVK